MQTIEIESVIAMVTKHVAKMTKFYDKVKHLSSNTTSLHDMSKIKLKLNEKIPMNQWKDKSNHHKDINSNLLNSGIPTGTLIVSSF